MSLKRKSKNASGVGADRRNIASLCAESVKFFSQPCMTCEEDWVEEKNKFISKSKAPFKNALICLLAKDGSLRFDTVLQVPVIELSMRSKTKLQFGYAEGRVS